MTAPTTPPPQKKVFVASFPTTSGAQAGLERLKAGGARLGNVALVQRKVDGGVEFSETQDWGLGKSAAVGALAAMLLPGIGIVMGAIGGAAAAYFIDAGFPDALLKQMGSGIPVGTSLMVGLVDEQDTAHAERVVVEAGGTVVGSGLESDLTQVLERMRGA
jgi:uncharacterized membrane protein